MNNILALQRLVVKSAAGPNGEVAVSCMSINCPDPKLR